MAIDTYAPCPGGTGKKIKFCCSELVGDLEQLDRLVEGDQISAALDQVKRLAAKHPGRACLLATQTKLELASKQFTEAAATAGQFLAAHPANPLALGQSAVTEAVAGRIQEAAALFDKAREAAMQTPEGGTPPLQELARIAATLVQAAAQLGHVGFAQGIVDWLVDTGVGSARAYPRRCGRGCRSKTSRATPPGGRSSMPRSRTPEPGGSRRRSPDSAA